MSLTPEQREELDGLLFALRDETLDDAGLKKLEQLALADEEARRRFVVLMDLRAGLCWRYAARPELELPGHAASDAPGVASSPPSKASPLRAGREWRWAIAAALLLALGLGVGLFAWNRPGANAGPSIARITRAVAATWHGVGAEVGSGLAAARKLDLASGLVEITFDNGARIVLEGPSKFEMSGPKGGVLGSGSLTARVPLELKGFTVETAGLTVVDLGTEFGVRALESGDAEVHVFDGAVEAAVKHGKPQKVTLGKHQAVECDAATGSLVDVVFDEDRFVRDVARGRPAVRQSAAFAESFDGLENLKLQQGYKCLDVAAVLSKEDRHEGTGAVEISWRSAADNYGVVYLAKNVPPTDIRGRTLSVWVKPLLAGSGYWGMELYDDRGRLVERHRTFDLPEGKWNQLRYTQGRQKPGGHFLAGSGNPHRVSKVVFRAQTHQPNQSARDLWDDFRLEPHDTPSNKSPK